jgi:hypothetical protein
VLTEIGQARDVSGEIGLAQFRPLSRARRVTSYYACQFLMMGCGKTAVTMLVLDFVLDFVCVDNEWGASEDSGGHRHTVTLTQYCPVQIL